MDKRTDTPQDPAPGRRHQRRPRYAGRHPRRFEEKYKELNPEQFPETIQKVIESGKTPAGSHRPIMTVEILQVLAPRPGEVAVDCTLGYGGHARELLTCLKGGGRLVGLDQDPIELPKTEARLRQAGFGPEIFTACRSNFAGLAAALARLGIDRADVILADLGVSSMQLDDPKRGFSVKNNGPLDMRMNPGRGRSAATLLQSLPPRALRDLLAENADEPNADLLGTALAGQTILSTGELAVRIRTALARFKPLEVEQSVRLTFQALRIAVNDELSALDALLRQLPACLRPGGRVAILTFHSGEDRRVKKAFATGLREGFYAEIAREVVRPTAAECHANPRAASAKLRWARASEAG